MPAPLLVIAAGGTGGHMFPAQALAEEMLARGWRVTLATDARGARYAGGFPRRSRAQVTAAATFARGGVLARAAVPFAHRRRRRWRAVLAHAPRPAGRASWASAAIRRCPALIAARALRLPRLIHEQNGVLGRVNRALRAARRRGRLRHLADRRCPTGARAIHVGNPVRAAVLDRAGAAYIAPGDAPDGAAGHRRQPGRAGIFVATSCRRRSRLLPPELRGAPAASPSRSGPRTWTASRTPSTRTRASRPSSAPSSTTCRERLAEATLVISRAGAALDRRHHRDRPPGDPDPLRRTPPTTTRRPTPRALVAAGGAFMIREDGVDAGGPRGAHRRDPDRPRGRRGDGARRAAAQGRPDATERTGGRLVERRSPRPERGTSMNGQTPPAPRHRGDPLRRHRRHRHVGHRRGAAEPRLHRPGLGRARRRRSPSGWRRKGAHDLHRPDGREPRGRRGRGDLVGDQARQPRARRGARARTCRWCAGPRCWPS